MGRYDWLYELRPVPIKEKVVDEVARHLARDLDAWPPPVEAWLSEADRRRFAPLYEAPVRPPEGALRYALRLLRMELRNEFEAIDYEMRNERWRAHVHSDRDMEGVHLLVRWLVDTLLAVKEMSGQALTRRDLVDVVDRIERIVAPSPLVW